MPLFSPLANGMTAIRLPFRYLGIRSSSDVVVFEVIAVTRLEERRLKIDPTRGETQREKKGEWLLMRLEKYAWRRKGALGLTGEINKAQIPIIRSLIVKARTIIKIRVRLRYAQIPESL